MAKWPYNTKRWQRLRVHKLQADPMCEYCPPGRRKPATQVDHKVAINDGGDPWDMDNLASCCASCHSRKTAREDGAFGAPKRKGPPMGACDENGKPLNPRHWWNDKNLSGLKAMDRCVNSNSELVSEDQ